MSDTLPAMQIKTRPFLGTEAEGPYIGERVLFFPGPTNLTDYHKYRYLLPEVKGLYYGAGNNRDVNPVTFMEILKDAKTHNLHVTIEVDTFHQWLKWLRDRYPYNVVFVGECVDRTWLQGYADYYKTLIDGNLIWNGVADNLPKFSTPLDSPIFALDQDAPPKE